MCEADVDPSQSSSSWGFLSPTLALSIHLLSTQRLSKPDDLNLSERVEPVFASWPWLLYREMGSREARFYDPVRETVHNRPEYRNLEGTRFLGSTLGWVVMSNSVAVHPREHHQTSLYNPFISERYQLPPLIIRNPHPRTVVRYGVLTGDPREDNTYVCLLTDNFYIYNGIVTMSIPREYMYYVAKRNGQWDQYWSVTSIPNHHNHGSPIESISPSADKISLIIRGHSLEFTFQTQDWNVRETQENDPIEWNPFHGQTFDQIKHRLQISPQIPTTLSIIGTKTDRERVKNSTWDGGNHSVSYIEGVWIEVRV
ncbi:PREDICTED: uncharacterized protein LOC104731635 [Camelina sativa]|uniref:Uncharacterized protein LOC104731635 n=1 Tax=Camelina sativa TaxID=90675 RepID=A0ABM1QQR3_CAMSA|nr:PREDICTED: uncharacterized protein LOC104731635 [Camelina sativa]